MIKSLSKFSFKTRIVRTIVGATDGTVRTIVRIVTIVIRTIEVRKIVQ